MNSAERKAKLTELVNTKTPCRTGIPIMYHGQRTEFPAYEIPLEYLVYNPYNGRIGSVVKSYERQNHTVNPEDPADKRLIEKFLWESKVEANKTTKKRLVREHQEKHGIITADGIIIDGNRRAMLLNNIMADDSIPFSEKSHCQFFTAIILPADADKKEILALETTYQMGEDAKVDYNPIEKYLKCQDLKDAGFTDDDIVEMMGLQGKGEVKTMLQALQLMDEYLDEYGYGGMYTQLDRNEDSFLKLDSALRKYKAGVMSIWPYEQSDVSDLKLIAFDYIREGFEQTLFRNIISAPTSKKPASSFFAKKEVWEPFRDRHFEITSGVSEDTVEQIRATNPPDLSLALRARDQQWALDVEDEMEENFTRALDQLNNHANAAKPLQQLIKACQALEVVDTSQDSFRDDAAVKGCVQTLEKFVEDFKAILGM